MGWTSYHAEMKYRNGRSYIDRKEECDNQFTWENGNVKCKVLKSKMVGSVWYAACEMTRETGSYVIGAVCLTSVDKKDYYNFSYKDMTEDMHPYYYDCPESILKLLTPTDNDCANKWRQHCHENNANKNNPRKMLSSLPVGSIIKYTFAGDEVKLIKHKADYQFKRPFWMVLGGTNYMPRKYIPLDYEIVQKGES